MQSPPPERQDPHEKRLRQKFFLAPHMVMTPPGIMHEGCQIYFSHSGCDYTTQMGSNIIRKCYIDNTELAFEAHTDPDLCCEKCSQYAGCVAFSYDSSKSSSSTKTMLNFFNCTDTTSNSGMTAYIIISIKKTYKLRKFFLTKFF